jgi:predicted dehydrogenase
MERLRAGVIGVGAIAQIMHLPYLRELDDRFQISPRSVTSIRSC